jgi:hypothetical protein
VSCKKTRESVPAFLQSEHDQPYGCIFKGSLLWLDQVTHALSTHCRVLVILNILHLHLESISASTVGLSQGSHLVSDV